MHEKSSVTCDHKNWFKNETSVGMTIVKVQNIMLQLPLILSYEVAIVSAAGNILPGLLFQQSNRFLSLSRTCTS